MCGILGGWQLTGNTHRMFSRNNVWRALEILRHRGPDDLGLVSGDPKRELSPATPVEDRDDDMGPLVLGHRRLSILDLSSAGHQPMSSRDGQAIVVYNGEIYNYIELREELQALGHRFVSRTDTEVLLEAYRQWGEDCLKRFNGMWGFVLFDLEKQTLFASRDRFGVKPLYYLWDGSTFVFCSEIGALLMLAGCARRASESAVYNYLTHALIPTGGTTFFENVYELPPGETLMLDGGGRLKRRRWWNLEPDVIGSNDVVERWRELFLDSVRIRLRSDVPVGACLSGGLDSSAIVGAMASLLRREGARVNTFTSYYDLPEYDERPFANAVSSLHRTVPEFIRQSSQDVLEDMERIITTQGEPFVSLSVFSQYAVMRRAKEKQVIVLLDGQGGDELFWGYDEGHLWYLAYLLSRGRIRKAFKTWLVISRNNSLLRGPSFIRSMGFYGFPWLRYKRNIGMAKGYLERDFLRTKKRDDPFFDLIPCAPTPAEMHHHYIESLYLPPLLRYEDRNSMAFSVETRLPFLDYRLVLLAVGLEPDQLLKDGWSKAVVREGMSNWTPDVVRFRKDKRGFPTPTNTFVQEFLECHPDLFGPRSRSSRFLNTAVLRDDGWRNPRWSPRLWQIVNLELWMRLMDVE